MKARKQPTAMLRSGDTAFSFVPASSVLATRIAFMAALIDPPSNVLKFSYGYCQPGIDNFFASFNFSVVPRHTSGVRATNRLAPSDFFLCYRGCCVASRERQSPRSRTVEFSFLVADVQCDRYCSRPR